MKIKEKLKKIQELPEQKRKLILWFIIIVLSLCFFIFWFINTKKNLINFQGQREKIIKKIIPKSVPTIPNPNSENKLWDEIQK